MVSNKCSPQEDGNSTEKSDGFLTRGSDKKALSVDEALSLLTDQRRRLLLYELQLTPPSGIDQETLAEQITKKERKPSDGNMSEDMRESVRLSLTHHHLPKLEDAGVAEFDQEDHVIQYNGDPVLEMYMDITEELENR